MPDEANDTSSPVGLFMFRISRSPFRNDDRKHYVSHLNFRQQKTHASLRVGMGLRRVR